MNIKPLENLRKSLGISIDEISSSTGLSPAQVTIIESKNVDNISQTIESERLLAHYAQLLDIDINKLRYCFVRESFSDIENRIAAPLIKTFTFLTGILSK